MHHITVSITDEGLDDPMTASVHVTESNPNINFVGEAAFTAVFGALRSMGYAPENIREFQETTNLKDI